MRILRVELDRELKREYQRSWDPAADERAGNQCKSYGAGAWTISDSR